MSFILGLSIHFLGHDALATLTPATRLHGPSVRAWAGAARKGLRPKQATGRADTTRRREAEKGLRVRQIDRHSKEDGSRAKNQDPLDLDTVDKEHESAVRHQEAQDAESGGGGGRHPPAGGEGQEGGEVQSGSFVSQVKSLASCHGRSQVGDVMET